MSRILVTGSTGFIGSTLCQSLRQSGYLVRMTQRNTANQINPEVKVVNIDERTNWSLALSEQTYVVHLAARTHVIRETSPNPMANYSTVNTKATLNLARQAVTAGVKRFIYISTAKVNGEGKSLPYAETDTPAPNDAYAVSKWKAEQGLLEIAAKTRLEVVILRPPLVYGPGVSANFLRLMRALDKGIPIPISRIENLRSLVYVENLVDAVMTCLVHPSAINRTFLISDGEDVSISTLIRRLAEALDCPARLLYFPSNWLTCIGTLTGKRKEIDRLIGSFILDTTAIKDTLGWSPPFSMHEGLAKTITWYRNNYGR